MEKSEWAEWKLMPQTKEFFAAISSKRQVLMELWSSGQFTAESSEGTAQLNARALGMIHILEELRDADEEWTEEFAKGSWTSPTAAKGG